MSARCNGKPVWDVYAVASSLADSTRHHTTAIFESKVTRMPVCSSDPLEEDDDWDAGDWDDGFDDEEDDDFWDEDWEDDTDLEDDDWDEEYEIEEPDDKDWEEEIEEDTEDLLADRTV